jgi:hypothetical protein
VSEVIVPLCWWSPLGGVIGAVVLLDEDLGYWKAYIGLASGDHQPRDAVAIARRGARLQPAVARAMAAELADAPLLERIRALRHLA